MVECLGRDTAHKKKEKTRPERGSTVMQNFTAADVSAPGQKYTRVRQQHAYPANTEEGAVATMCNTPPPFQRQLKTNGGIKCR